MHRQSKIRILLIGKNRPFAQSIRDVLRAEADLDVVSFADGMAQVVVSASDCQIALVDAEAYGQGQLLTLLQDIHDRCTSLKVITVGVPSSPERLLALIECGVSGYLGTEQVPHQLADLVRSVHQKQARLSPEVASMVMSRLSELHKSLANGAGNAQVPPVFLFELTAREQEVLELIGEGLSNREIAEHLIIEYGTAKNHVHNILRKLNVNSREKAAKLYATVGSQTLPMLPGLSQYRNLAHHGT